IEPLAAEKMSRPAELVQRAKQLAQLTNFKFGRIETVQQESVEIEEQPVTVPEIKLQAEPKTTAQKLEEFYGVKQMGQEVVFAARFESAKKVLVAGDFNNWSPMSTPMQTNGKPGVWTTKLPLPPG